MVGSQITSAIVSMNVVMAFPRYELILFLLARHGIRESTYNARFIPQQQKSAVYQQLSV